MASAGDPCSCENCGRLIGYYAPNMVGEIHPPRNAVTARKGLFVHTFCCDRCKNQWKSEKESSKSGIFGGMGNSDKGNENQLTPEQIVAKAEADEIRRRTEAEERRIRDQIDKEELEADKEKAKLLKAEGKKWLALWTSAGKYGRMGIGIGTAVSWFIGFKMLILLPIAILGTIFAGLVIKDSMKK